MELQVDQFTYKWNADWAKADHKDGFAHHGLVINRDGHIVTGHATDVKIMVYDKAGNLLREIPVDGIAETHGICLAEENGEEFIWIADASSKVVQINQQGEILKELTKADFNYADDQTFVPTTVAWDAAGKRLFVTDGYGSSIVTAFDQNFQILFQLDGSDGLGRFNCPHWVYVDTRKAEAELYIADRSNDRVQIYSLDGQYLRGINEGLVTPSVFGHFGEYMVVGELKARLVLLDKQDRIVGYIGDGTHHVAKPGWPNRKDAADQNIKPLDDIPVGEFNSPHGMACDENGDIYVSEWLLGDRFTKLELVPQ